MKIKLLSIIFLCIPSFAQAQTVQDKLNSIFEKRDILELERYYSQNKDSIQPSTDIACRAFMAMAYNRPEEACNLMLEMNEKFPQQLGSITMISLWAYELYNTGEYQTASGLLSSVLEQLQSQNVPEKYTSELKEHFRINKALSQESKVSIINNETETTIPIKRKKDDTYIYSDVLLNGKQAEAFFDTGSITLVNEDFAKANHVRILNDSMTIMSGLKDVSVNNKFGIIDSLIIGGFRCYNVPCYITGGGQVECDVLIGLDLLRHFGEIRIYPKKNELILSQNKKQEAKPHNMMIWGKVPYIECMYRNERQTFLFDTGNNHEGIYRPHFFEPYKSRFTSIDPARTVGKLRIYQLKPFDLTFGDTTKTMTDFFLFENGDFATTTGSKEFPDGNMGVNFVNQCDEFILNFHNMYYEVK